jgi:hypothetical protein
MAIALSLALAGCAGATSPNPGNLAQRVASGGGCTPSGTAYVRTTLYFGLTRPAGTVSEPEWQGFLQGEVTSRFPNGFTVLEADGQWRRADGTVGRERTKILVVVHDGRPAAYSALIAIVTDYKKKFEQESVLWETASVCAAF